MSGYFIISVFMCTTVRYTSTNMKYICGVKLFYSRFQLHFFVDSPKIVCFSTEAYIGEKNINIRCEIRAKPRCSALFWIIDSNGTALSEGEVINGHWTLIIVSHLEIGLSYILKLFIFKNYWVPAILREDNNLINSLCGYYVKIQSLTACVDIMQRYNRGGRKLIYSIQFQLCCHLHTKRYKKRYRFDEVYI